MLSEPHFTSAFRLTLDNLGFFVRELGPIGQASKAPPKNVENLLRLYEGADPDGAKQLRSLAAGDQGRAEISEDPDQLDAREWSFLRGGIITKQATLEEILKIDPCVQAARRIVVEHPEVETVIMGHTHETDRTEITRLPDVDPGDKWYVNTGAWIKTQSVRDARKARSWAELNLDDNSVFLTRFVYVVIEYENGRPKKPVRSFWTD